MPSQAEQDVQDEIASRFLILDQIRKAAAENSAVDISNYLALEDSALAIQPGPFTDQSNAALLSGVRGALNSAVSSGVARAICAPLLLNYARVIGDITDSDPQEILAWLYKRFIDSSLSVKSRDISFGTPAAGSNIGTGVINRLTKDAYGFDIEAVHIEAKRAYCIADSNGSAGRFEEEFRFQGSTPELDQIVIGGSGKDKRITCLSERSSRLGNSSFDALDGIDETSLNSIPSWTVGGEGITNYEMDSTNIYRALFGTASSRALKFLGNGAVTQKFSLNNIKFTSGRPIYAQIAYNRSVGSCNGLLWFSIGNASVSVSLAAQSGWQILRLPLNKMLWPQNMLSAAGNDATEARIQLTGRTSGTLLVDSVILQEMDNFDGTWYAPVAGRTPFVAGARGGRDQFTWADTLNGSDSLIQHWLWRAYGAYLPAVKDSTETWVDPSV